jgi:hypothetical protein
MLSIIISLKTLEEEKSMNNWSTVADEATIETTVKALK